MNGGWRYRVAGVAGTVAIVAGAVFLANQPPIRSVLGLIPFLSDLLSEGANGSELFFEAVTAAAVVAIVMVPLYKPRPRRILDIWMEGFRRTAIGLLGLATVGYFDYTYRLPRATLIVTGVLLLPVLPAYFVAIRRRPSGVGDRTVIIGDNPQSMADILDAVEGDVIGYVSPPSPYDADEPLSEVPVSVADGGEAMARLDELPCVGGLSRLDEVLVDYDVDTAVLAFAHTDRQEFFGALDTCYDHGVQAKVHRDHADAVLTSGTATGELVDIDLEPWDIQDYVFKRLFDVAFAGVGLLLTAPLAAVISIAIKLDSPGPVLYSQERTATFGQTFTVYKFRTMTVGDEQSAPNEDTDNSRITRVGRFLRRTHLDEIPQLLAILSGKMSVVGPRATWTDEEVHLEESAEAWRKRWFVKPGLTGLAQINGVTSTDPEEKLRYDVEYIRNQSFWFDLKVVFRQVWAVIADVGDLIRGR